MTQTEMVKKYIEDFGSITPLDSIRYLGVYRLSACIFVLRKKHRIITEMEYGTNVYTGKRMSYARYKFADGVNE